MLGAAVRPLLRPSSNLIRTAARVQRPACVPSLLNARLSLSAVRFASSAPRYSDDHEWITVDENNVGTVGITDYAQKALGDVVYVEVVNAGEQVDQGGFMGSVESVKAASDVYSPVSGVIESVNETLVDQASLLNKDPMGKGWICKIKLSEPAEVESLMNEEAYKAFCETAGSEDH